MIERVSDTECRVCSAMVTPSMIGACASVGIEHGRSTRDELTFYLAAVHERESHQHIDVVVNDWSAAVQRLHKRDTPDSPHFDGSYMFTTAPHGDDDCPFRDVSEIPMRTTRFSDEGADR